MKTFVDYLAESKKTYKFIVRVAGELPEGFSERLESNMKKFGLLELSNAKRTPIQEKPLDFPNLNNTEVHTFTVEVQYPTTNAILQNYLVDNCVIPRTHLIVRNENDPIEMQQQPSEDAPYETMLTKEDMGGESAQKEVGNSRVMDLLKELEKARKERDVNPINGVKPGEAKDVKKSENAKSVMGS